jgi:hypothetical protein
MPSRKTKRMYKKERNQKNNKNTRRRGGDSSQDLTSKLDQFQITNVEVIIFLIDFLDKTNLKNIFLTHYKFINAIETEKLVFNENPEFRKFMNDIIQWFLLDYNQEFSNCLLEIIKKTIENAVFLNKTTNPDEKYNILLLNVYDMIVKYNNNEDARFFSLLQILLRGLRMPKVKEMILSSLQPQEDNLIQYKNTIVCLLDNIIKNDLLHKEEIRQLIKQIIEELSYQNAYNWNTFKKLTALVSNCALTITSNISSVAAKAAYNASANVASGVYNSTLGKIF